MTIAVLDPPQISAGVASPRTIFAGVDTHKDTHRVAIVDGLGRRIADREFRYSATKAIRQAYSACIALSSP